jgi:hypothetical protein
MKLIAGNSNGIITKGISEYLKISMTDATIKRFADEEVFVEINENIRGEDVFLIQSTSFPANDHIMELLLTVTAARRSGANRIIAVVPYFAYKYHRRGLPISSLSHSRFLWSASNDLAKMLQTVGVDGVLGVLGVGVVTGGVTGGVTTGVSTGAVTTGVVITGVSTGVSTTAGTLITSPTAASPGLVITSNVPSVF